MKCLVLAAGYATRLYPLTKNFPKPLLEVGGKAIIDWLLEDIDQIESIDSHIIISNHRYYNHFINWKNNCKLTKPVTVLDDGSTDNENRLGAVKDIQFAIDSLSLDDDLLVIAGDNIVDFSFRSFVQFAKEKGTTCIMTYKELSEEALKRCGIITPDNDFKVLSMVEKPEEPPTNWAVPPFYIYARSDVPYVSKGIAEGCNTDAPGSFISWLCERRPVYAMPMPGKRYDIGTLESYERVKRIFE
jgi:glucose-1-phosphate thymidylyltransferase